MFTCALDACSAMPRICIILGTSSDPKRKLVSIRSSRRALSRLNPRASAFVGNAIGRSCIISAASIAHKPRVDLPHQSVAASPPGCNTSRTSSQLITAGDTNTNETIHVNDFGHPTSSLLHAVHDLRYTVKAAGTRAFVSLILANAHQPLQTD